jgi:hypothetical protein
MVEDVMKRFLQSAVVLGVVSLVGAGVAQAQGAGRASFHLGGGVSLPTGDFGDGAKTGWHALGGVNFGLGALPFVIRVDGFYGQNNGDEAVVGPDVKAKFFGGMAGAQFNFGGASPVHPYILGQVGMVNNKFEGPGGDVSNTDFAFQGGAGIEFGKFFAEGKYLSIQTDPSSVNLIVISAGIRFGGGM